MASGCERLAPASGAPARPVVKAGPLRSDLEGLARHVHLPLTPTKVLWQGTVTSPANADRGVPGPSSVLLEAVLTFRPEDEKALRERLEPHRLARSVVWHTFADWHPPSLRACFERDASTGRHRLTCPCYDAREALGQPAGSAYLVSMGNGALYLTLSVD
jgi:hypothetical protein